MTERHIVMPERKVLYADRCRSSNQYGLVVWFTGLSGSGKSTIAAEVEKELLARKKAVYWLDGDALRDGLNSDLGFSEQDRRENIRRIAEIAALFKDAAVVVLVSVISPAKEMRDFARIKAGDSGFIEVYVKADIRTCEQRDLKGLYKRARAGEITNFTGISAPYEEPETPDLVVNTDVLTIAESVELVLAKIRSWAPLNEREV